MSGPAAPRGLREPAWVLRVDPILCRAHGLCAELLPESVDLDEWGYAIARRPVPPIALPAARAAVASCPTLALRLVAARSDAVR